MMATDEERREVAEELRGLRHMTYYSEEVVESIKDAIGIADPVNTFREPEDIYELLADLIDPGAPSGEDKVRAASKLRSYGHDELKAGSLLKTLKDVTGTGDGSWRDVLLRLADLIEPAVGR